MKFQQLIDTSITNSISSKNNLFGQASPELPTMESITMPCVKSRVTGNLKNLNFTAPAGISNFCIDLLHEHRPIHFYSLFVDDEIINYLVCEPNRYASQSIVDGIVNDSISKCSRLNV